MSDKSRDSETERIRRDWSLRGEFWDRRADEIVDMAAQFNGPLLEALDLAPGLVVLDCATGAGEPAMTAAVMIEPDGRLVATDLVPEMLAGAQRRAQERHLENIEFQIADMTALPFDDGVYDRVISRFGVMFAPDPVSAAREACRVLKPGGRAAYMVWGPVGDNTMFDVLSNAADEVFGADDPDIDFKTPFKLAGDGALKAVMEAGGFSGVEESDLTFAPRVPAAGRIWEVPLDMGMGDRLARAGAKERQALEAKIAANLEAHLHDGRYHLSVHVKIGSGVKPAA